MQLSDKTAGTLARRLYDALRERIQAGELGPGTRLPSSRRLARELGLGRNTVLDALERLVAEGFAEARQGAGLFVAALDLTPVTSPPGEARVELPPLSRRGRELLERCGDMRGSHRAFAPGIPALDRFPHALWARLLRRHQRHVPTAWLGYQTQGGLPALKAALADYLQLSRSVRCRPEQILITQGAQQGFELIARLLTDPNDPVWIEEPGYGGAQACFAAAGLERIPVPVDDQGIDPAAAPASPSPRLIYTTPSHQYPAGATLTLARRLALLAAAERHGAWLVEDDYDSEFRYTTPPVASLQGLATQAPVIYVGTFSKVLYPGLRLGYLVLPEALVDDFRRANARLHREGGYAVQAALADFIAEGHFARHVARMRHCYRQRQVCLREALAPALAEGLELTRGQAGMHLVAWLDDHAQERDLVARGEAAGVTLAPLSRFYLGEASRPGLVLGYAGADEAEIARAGAWLCQAWRETRSPRLPQRSGQADPTGE
ncbi:PLP-dependent aminotransferase family protein [Modicisalibacter coralii]|uniref:MocR-like pyridoxine biosynthesis transcription factor PdxR n=1 Tax=Modicisalibacter coralii TaxID=2304602 RepID=UPI00100AF7E4|nr:PLP-dependent aminotransferase family protein [Halomonas coralii]